VITEYHGTYYINLNYSTTTPFENLLTTTTTTTTTIIIIKEYTNALAYLPNDDHTRSKHVVEVVNRTQHTNSLQAQEEAALKHHPYKSNNYVPTDVLSASH
jgi:hypothetical protein